MLWWMPSPTPSPDRFDLDRARSVLTLSGEIDLAVTANCPGLAACPRSRPLMQPNGLEVCSRT